MTELSKIITALVVLFTALTTGLSAAVPINDNLALDAEFRPRVEFDDRDFNVATGFDSYGSIRTRLGFRIEKAIPNTAFYLQLADSRTMGFGNPYLNGDPPGPNGCDNNLGVTKVYVEIRDFYRPGTMLRVGRFDNDQGRAYILGPGNWSFYGPRTYDGLKVGVETENQEWHLWTFYGANGDRHWIPSDSDPAKTPNPARDYKRDHTLTGADYTFWKKQLNLLTFLDLDQQPVLDTLHYERNVTSSRWTFAGNLKLRPFKKKPGLWFDGDLAWQTGTMGLAYGEADIAGWMSAGDLAYHHQDPLDLWCGLGFHFTSGDDAADSLDAGWFWDDYSSKHKIHGHMDYFTNDLGIKANGLRDYMLRAGLEPLRNLSVAVDFHHFMVQEAFPSKLDGSGTNTLGQELDILAAWQARKGLTPQLGLDFFCPTEEWKGEDAKPAFFVYLVLTAQI